MSKVTVRDSARSLIGAIALAAMAVAARPSAQVPPPPQAQSPQAAPALAATGTGVIMGRVIDGGSNKPIQGAYVALTVLVTPPAPGVAGGPAIPNFRPQAVVTGSDGVFVFSALPKGTFLLVSSSPFGNGPIGDSQSNQMLTLAEGEKLNDVEVRFFRPGVVTGQVRDERGDGVEGVAISLLRMKINGGRRSLMVAATATTDDRGAYRMRAVTPGDYGVCALFTRHIAPLAAGLAQAAGNADQQRTLSGSGAMSPSGSGYRIGDFVLISSSASRNIDPAPDENGRLSVFADACYPSAPNIQGLEIVHVDSGQERGQLDMVVRIVPSVRITGTVTGPANRLSGMAVHLYTAAPGETSLADAIESAQTVTDPDGGFGFVGVPQGSYVLRAVFTGDRALPPEYFTFAMAQGLPIESMMSSSPQTNAPPEPTWWASLPVTVGDSDVNGLTLSLREAPRVTGTIAFDGSKERPQTMRMTAASVILEAVDNATYSGVSRGRVSADGTFATPGVIPGRYFVRPNFPFPGWTIKSITFNGRDVFDEPLEVGAAEINGVVITMTDRPNELSGTVRVSSGQPDRHARVVVFPSDRTRWPVVTAGRRTVMTVVTRQGTYSFSGLPAGDYFVAAMSDQADSNWQNPKMLEVLSRTATLVTFREGDRRTVDLTTSVVR